MVHKPPERTTDCTDPDCSAKFFNEEQMYEHHKAKHQGPMWWAWIGKRARGVYLANVREEMDAYVDKWEAFPSEDAAKRWCAAEIGRKRLPWVRGNDGALVVEEFRP